MNKPEILPEDDIAGHQCRRSEVPTAAPRVVLENFRSQSGTGAL